MRVMNNISFIFATELAFKTVTMLFGYANV
jgi:hypothetical protein